jgi:hypothetical protein
VLLRTGGAGLYIPGVQVMQSMVGAGAEYAGPFDGITFAALYGMKRFLTAYEGPLIRLLRDSDDAEADIGYDEATGMLDTAAAAAHLSGANGFIDTWYDQSGNSRDYSISAFPAFMPPYSASAINSKPAVNFDGVTVLQMASYLSGVTAGSQITVLQLALDPPVDGNKTGLYAYGTDSTTHVPFTDGVIYDNFGSNARKTVGNPTPALTSARVYSVVSQSGSWVARIDGASIFSTGTNTVAWNTGTLELGRSGGSFYVNGPMAFHCVLASAISDANHNAIGNEMASLYGMTWSSI